VPGRGRAYGPGADFGVTPRSPGAIAKAQTECRLRAPVGVVLCPEGGGLPPMPSTARWRRRATADSAIRTDDLAIMVDRQPGHSLAKLARTRLSISHLAPRGQA
jgi:hypothetical protein